MRPIHPGIILQEDFMAPVKMNSSQLARCLNTPPNRISAILNGNRGITAETALRLSRFFNNSPEFWLNLQQRYDLLIAKEELGKRIKQEVQPIVGGFWDS